MSPKIPKYLHHEETEIQRLLGSPSDSFHIVSCGIVGWLKAHLGDSNQFCDLVTEYGYVINN